MCRCMFSCHLSTYWPQTSQDLCTAEEAMRRNHPMRSLVFPLPQERSDVSIWVAIGNAPPPKHTWAYAHVCNSFKDGGAGSPTPGKTSGSVCHTAALLHTRLCSDAPPIVQSVCSSLMQVGSNTCVFSRRVALDHGRRLAGFGNVRRRGQPWRRCR